MFPLFLIFIPSLLRLSPTLSPPAPVTDDRLSPAMWSYPTYVFVLLNDRTNARFATLLPFCPFSHEGKLCLFCWRWECPPPPPIAGRIYCCSQILSPWLVDTIDSGIGLYRPARLHRPVGRYSNTMPESTISPSQGLRIWPV
jgi:hypothetical protein